LYEKEVFSWLFAVFSSYIIVFVCEKAGMTIQNPLPVAIPAVREHFARRLKELRIPRGYPTARSLSRALGIDENRYTRYERAEVEPDLSLLLKICGLLQASPNDLLIPVGFDDPQHAYTAEAPANAKPSKASGVRRPASATAASHDPLRRRAIAWQLATELVGCGAVTSDASSGGGPLARLQQIKKVFGELDTDAFSTIGRILDDAPMKTVAAGDAEKISTLVEELISAIADDGLGHT
jgi:transcriptional regulator with XRE-family HTH domain